MEEDTFQRLGIQNKQFSVADWMVKEIMDDRGNKEHLIECLKVAALNIYNI